jgi:CubicO group peptidase (beta-lactamase class C family)
MILFLSCGNLGTANADLNFKEKRQNKKIVSALTDLQQRMAYKLDTLFTHMYEGGIFNGSVLVAKAGKVIYQKSLGVLDKSANHNLTDSSMFQLASVSKVITATAVLMLHEKQLLDINKPFSDYFPDFPYAGITVKELLNHRSGLPNYIYSLNEEICKPSYQMSNMDMYKCFVSKNTQAYLKPNTRFNYCNTNYALLALLIEKVSGKTYSAYLKDELFTPLGMRNTATIRDIDLNGKNTAKPYDRKWKQVEFDASDYVLGDKSIYSTPYDLFLFSEALYQNKIIKQETQQLAYTAFSKEKKLSNYGYGWRMKNFNDPVKKEVYHNGWWHGYRSSFHRRLNDTLTVIILSNQLNKTAYQTHRIYEILDSAGSDVFTEDE